jgi:hypothetical protein
MALIETADGRWFPAFAPTKGTLWIRIVDDLTAGIIPTAVDPLMNPSESYQDRETAISACHAWHEAAVAPVYWNRLTAHTEIYPERNIWYREEIARLTGDAAVSLFSGTDVHAVTSIITGRGDMVLDVITTTPDEAIEALYQRVYEWSCQHQVVRRAIGCSSF